MPERVKAALHGPAPPEDPGGARQRTRKMSVQPPIAYITAIQANAFARTFRLVRFSPSRPRAYNMAMPPFTCKVRAGHVARFVAGKISRVADAISSASPCDWLGICDIDGLLFARR